LQSWNLFEASIYPDTSKVGLENGTVAFGLLDFFEAPLRRTARFLDSLAYSPTPQKNSLKRYSTLKGGAKP
jgi:hypothetical protein